MSKTTSLREALAYSQPQDVGLVSCAQRYSDGRHFVIAFDGTHWMLLIDELVLPTPSLESAERILTTGNVHVPLGEGWLGQAPKNDFGERLRVIQEAIANQREAGRGYSFIFLGEEQEDE